MKNTKPRVIRLLVQSKHLHQEQMTLLICYEPNLLCMEGKQQLHKDSMILNEKGVMTRFVTQECRFIIGILPKVQEVHRVFEFHNCGWMTRDIGTCSEDIVPKFYVSYVSTLLGFIDRSKRSSKQAPLTSTLLQGNREKISQATIHIFLYSPTTGSQWTWNTSKFDYRWKIVQSCAFRKIEEQLKVNEEMAV